MMMGLFCYAPGWAQWYDWGERLWLLGHVRECLYAGQHIVW